MGSLCFDFSFVQCSIHRGRARYTLRLAKNKDILLSFLQACFVITHSSGDFIKFYRRNHETGL